MYGPDYYQSANYTDYLDRRDRYLRTAAEIAELLGKLSLLRRDDLVLDLGCALGFLLDGFKEAGYRAEGVEVSAWARERARERGCVVREAPVRADVLVALDVLEHMTDDEVLAALGAAQARAVVARIPVSTDGGQTFHLACSRRDPTHVNCKTREGWRALFARAGYPIALGLSLYSVYDSEGVACLLAVRDDSGRR